MSQVGTSWNCMSLLLLVLITATSISTNASPSTDAPIRQVDSSALYSHAHCWGIDTAPTATCIFDNVCIDTSSKRLMFWAGTGRSPPELRLGVYDTSPLLPISLQHGTRSDQSHSCDGDTIITDTLNQTAKNSAADSVWCGRGGATCLIYRSHKLNYFHSLVDDYFGIWYMQHRTQTDCQQFIYFDEPHSDRSKSVQTTPLPADVVGARLTPDAVHVHSLPRLACSNRVIAGPMKRQLGGPGIVHVSPELLLQFRRHTLDRLGLRHPGGASALWLKGPIFRRVLYVSRKQSRRVLNEDELIERLRQVLSDEFDASLVVADLSTMSLREQVQLFSECSAVVAMHGAALANVIFLPFAAIVVEMLPYGVHRPIYKIIAGKTGTHYTSWANTNVSATTFDNTILNKARQGAGFSDSDVLWIQNDSGSITASMVANDYWMSQDTVVDVEAVTLLLTQSIDAVMVPALRLVYQQQLQQKRADATRRRHQNNQHSDKHTDIPSFIAEARDVVVDRSDVRSMPPPAPKFVPQHPQKHTRWYHFNAHLRVVLFLLFTLVVCCTAGTALRRAAAKRMAHID